MRDPIAPGLQRVVLFGFMGSGKSTIGRLLARQLGWSLFDMDAYIEQQSSKPIHAIFTDHGEAHFRALERQALASALSRQRIVVALGGGALDAAENRDSLLAAAVDSLLVHLDVPFASAVARCTPHAERAGLQTRPVLRDPVEAARRYTLRAPLYAEVRHHQIDTTATDPAETARMICGLLTR